MIMPVGAIGMVKRAGVGGIIGSPWNDESICHLKGEENYQSKVMELEVDGFEW